MTPVKAAQAGLVWRVARKASASTSSHVPGRRLKLSSIVDQEGRCLPSFGMTSTVHHTHGRAATKGGGTYSRPAASAVSQVWLTGHRVVCRPRDLVQFRQRHSREQVPDFDSHDGLLVHFENVLQWLKSKRVFEAALVMLGFLTVASLALFEKAMERLTRLWPSAWHLIVGGDDKCRAEHTERIRSGLEEKHSTSKTVRTDCSEQKSCLGSRRRTRTSAGSRGAPLSPLQFPSQRSSRWSSRCAEAEWRPSCVGRHFPRSCRC